jgi:translation initiation factor IF-3
LKKRFYKTKKRRVALANARIRAPKVRLIDEEGKQLGILDLKEALKISRQHGLDLVQLTDKTEPPVCRILDYGKYLYNQKKKEKAGKTKAGEVKGIRLTFGISSHDLEVRAKKAKEFLEKGYKLRLEMRLRGRQKKLRDFAKNKIEEFLEILKKETAIKIEGGLRNEANGLIMIITKL